MESRLKQEIQVAVNWWAEALKRPKFDNGDSSRVGAMASMMALMNTTEPTEDQLSLFKERLTKKLSSVTEDELRSGLHCDYGPDQILSEAAEGLSASFPWKTNMWIQPGSVRVSHGYGQPDQELMRDGSRSPTLERETRRSQ